ncbi:hypothetical protein Plhal304r1_c003g0013941 [Plasmopara halstedii]
MRRWNVIFYGDLPVYEDRAGLLKVLYVLVLLLHGTAKLTKRSYACNLAIRIR